MRQPGLKQYPFVRPTEEGGYRLFPRELENDPLVFFHGTTEVTFPSILQTGFKSFPPLESVSFDKSSGFALGHACKKRNGGRGCVIAVKLDTLNHPGLELSSTNLHLFPASGLTPEIIGYCIVPAEYDHV